MSWLLIVVLGYAFKTGLANKIPVADCGSSFATIHSIDVEPCPKTPCEFKRNSFISLTITFTPNITIDNVTAEAAGSFFNTFINYNLDDTDACHAMKCPSKPGELVTYRTKIPVYPTWPEITLVVRWRLRIGSTYILCFTLPVTITA
ncbi:unnamed protein product [Candidula unifasciata]|uniref:MD-2-related lipid-recognition domain-containing protein n=1 Tax=Candidula unifasciata TaxID=100452 RepID=A0A8S3YXP0_9EUPU|nr:unnamed protein product [Candidula unifasciata]